MSCLDGMLRLPWFSWIILPRLACLSVNLCSCCKGCREGLWVKGAEREASSRGRRLRDKNA